MGPVKGLVVGGQGWVEALGYLGCLPVALVDHCGMQLGKGSLLDSHGLGQGVVEVEAPPAADGEGGRCAHHGLEDTAHILQEQVEEGLPLLLGHLVHVGLSVLRSVGQCLPSSQPSRVHQAEQVKVKEQGGDPLAVLDGPTPAPVVDCSPMEVAGADVVATLEGLLDVAAAIGGRRPHGSYTGVRMLRVHLLTCHLAL